MAKQNKMFALVVGQCSPALKSELKCEPDFSDKTNTRDCIWLLNTLCLLCAGIDKNTDRFHSSVSSMANFFETKQLPDETMPAYHSRFEAAVATAILGNGTHFGSSKLIAYEVDANSTSSEAAAQIVHDGYLAMKFLMHADPHRFRELWAQLDNSRLLGRNEFPRNLPSSYDLLGNFQSANTPNRPEREHAEVSFAQTQTAFPPPTPGDNGRIENRTK